MRTVQASQARLCRLHTFEADLIVMGPHGCRGARRHLLGRVADTVMRSSQVLVLVVRDDALDESLAFGP